jgi:hypothetical protein
MIDVGQLLKNGITEMLQSCRVPSVMKVQRHPCQRSGKLLFCILPDGYYHTKILFVFPMLEGEVEMAGLDDHFPSSDEYGLESNALRSDVAVRHGLRALPNSADRCKIILGETVFIAINHNTVGVDVERNEWYITTSLGTLEAIVVGILEQLEYKSSITAVYFCRKPL